MLGWVDHVRAGFPAPPILVPSRTARAEKSTDGDLYVHFPQPPVSGSEPYLDVFERLLQCSGLLTEKELALIVHLSPKTLYGYANAI